MQKITPSIWFNGTAPDAVEYYTDVFRDGQVDETTYYPASAAEGLADFQLEMAGKELTIDFTIGDMHFTAINAGAEFKPNSSISFMVNFDPSRNPQAREHMDEVWDKLAKDGT